MQNCVSLKMRARNISFFMYFRIIYKEISVLANLMDGDPRPGKISLMDVFFYQ